MPNRELPSLQALEIFEEVALRRSCSEAAVHLGLTQSAVSKQIEKVERFIGLPLFNRLKGGLVPNAVGARLMADLQPVLDELERVCDRASREATNRKVVIIRALAMVSDRWLLPRLPEFFAANPDIDIQYSTFLVNSEFDRGGAEIEVRFGAGPWLDGDSTPLLGRRNVLIAPPATPLDTPLETLLKMPRLMHFQSRDIWAEFAAAHGIREEAPAKPLAAFDVFQVLVRAVRVGLGLAVVPACLIEEELSRGEVVNPGGYAVQSSMCYHLVTPHHSKPLSQAALTLHRWMVAEARKVEMV